MTSQLAPSPSPTLPPPSPFFQLPQVFDCLTHLGFAVRVCPPPTPPYPHTLISQHRCALALLHVPKYLSFFSHLFPDGPATILFGSGLNGGIVNSPLSVTVIARDEYLNHLATVIRLYLDTLGLPALFLNRVGEMKCRPHDVCPDTFSFLQTSTADIAFAISPPDVILLSKISNSTFWFLPNSTALLNISVEPP